MIILSTLLKDHFYFSQVAPCLLKYLTAESFKELRKTNVFWKEQLDLAYQTHPEQATLPAARIKTVFKRSEQIEDFLEEMESHPGNPFIGRNVKISYHFPMAFNGDLDEEDNDEEHSAFHVPVVQLMERFGKQLHTLHLQFDNEGDFEVEEFLSAILRFTPNLQGFKIQEGFYFDQERDHITTNLLPKLAHLKTLEVETGTNFLTGSLFSSLCDPKTIQRLTLKLHLHISYKADPVASAHLSRFTNLRGLSISGSSLDVWDNVEALLLAGSPLRKLGVHFSQSEIDFPRFGLALAHIQDSLEQLTLSADVSSSIWLFADNFDCDVIQLPKLTQLSLKGTKAAVVPILWHIAAPLRKVIVMFSDYELNWQKFFMTLARFGETVAEIQITGVTFQPKRMDAKDYDQLRAALPRLRELKILNMQGILEPVFCISSLTRFIVNFNEVEDSARAFELVDRVLKAKTTIWEIMPALQEFIVEGQVEGEEERKVVKHVRSKE